MGYDTILKKVDHTALRQHKYNVLEKPSRIPTQCPTSQLQVLAATEWDMECQLNIQHSKYYFNDFIQVKKI